MPTRICFAIVKHEWRKCRGVQRRRVGGMVGLTHVSDYHPFSAISEWEGGTTWVLVGKVFMGVAAVTNDIILSTGLLCRAVQTYTYEVKPLTGELARKVWFGNVWLAQFEHIRTSICMHISQLEVTLC